MYGEIKVFGGRAHPALTAEIAAYLSVPEGNPTVFNFSDGVISVQIEENVRGCDPGPAPACREKPYAVSMKTAL